MQVKIRKVGKSLGIVIPKRLMDAIGAKQGDEIGMELTGRRLVLSPTSRSGRQGWSDAAKAIAAAGDDKLVWPEFGNAGDDSQWS